MRKVLLGSKPVQTKWGSKRYTRCRMTDTEFIISDGTMKKEAMHQPHMLLRGIIVCIIASSSTQFGCTPNTATDSESSHHKFKPWNSAPTWDVLEIDGARVGFQSTQLKRSASGDTVFLDGRSTSEMALQRFGQSMSERMEIACRASASGEVIRVETRVTSNNNQQHTVGKRSENVLRMETRGTGSPRHWSIPLPESCGGYFAVEWSLRQKPMKSGEIRQLKLLLPIVNQVAVCELHAQTWQDETSEEPVLPISQKMNVANSEITGTIWTNRTGEVVRSEIPSIRQVTYRTNETTARSVLVQPATFDLATIATVPIETPIPNPHQSTSLQYRVQVLDGDPVAIFASTKGQVTTAGNAPHTADILVHKLRPSPNGTIGTTVPPDSTTQSSALIQSDNPAVLQHVERVNPPSNDPWDIAKAVEQYVYHTISKKNFSTALASAAEVAESLSGDCTEHAVLTAAICRALGVPARVLVGLVYVETEQAFVFHMWNEVWVSGRWIPIDSTLGRGGTGAAHLILTRSDLATEDAFSAFLPLLNVLGRLNIALVPTPP